MLQRFSRYSSALPPGGPSRPPGWPMWPSPRCLISTSRIRVTCVAWPSLTSLLRWLAGVRLPERCLGRAGRNREPERTRGPADVPIIEPSLSRRLRRNQIYLQSVLASVPRGWSPPRATARGARHRRGLQGRQSAYLAGAAGTLEFACARQILDVRHHGAQLFKPSTVRWPRSRLPPGSHPATMLLVGLPRRYAASITSSSWPSGWAISFLMCARSG